ncbi:phage tail tape measure protein [Mammaliicoccus sciuri]|uniref:phage tail tape measure protein n=1 Tax=Mammaliicoccus sciuri TaxID=1296 RepID=UPI00200AA2E8|nr:phage tail tape measure protein [Mammaliicoccus sciuri]
MPNNIKGFSVLMNMKDVNVERTLKQIKGQFKTLSSEMSRSTSNFKHSEKSMESFNKRAKELKKGIDVTKNSMEEITKRLSKMTIEEQRTSAEAEKLRLEYSKQHKALNMYERQLNQTKNEMNQFGQNTKRTVFSMEKISTVLGTMRKQLNIANMAFERGGKSTKTYENYLKSLNTVIEKHKRTIQTLETRYKLVSKEKGELSQEALELKQKILQEKNSLNALESQYKQTSVQAKQFAFEQKTATQSMSEIRQKITQVSNALKISSSNFKLTGQTAKAYKAHIAELNNSMKDQKLIVQNLSRQYDYAKKQYGETSKEAQELNLTLLEEKTKLKELGVQLKDTTQQHNRLEMEQREGISTMAEIRSKISGMNSALSLSRSNFSTAGESVKSYRSHLKTLNQSFREQKTVLKELETQYKIVKQTQGANSQEARELSESINHQKIQMNELETELKQTAQAYKEFHTQQKNAQILGSTGFGRMTQSVNKYSDTINQAGMNMRSAGTSGLLYMTMPIVAGFGAAVKVGADFEGQMARVGAIAGSSKKELKAMSDQAVDLGAKTSLSANEVAKGMEELAALGMNTNQIMAAMPGTISAAEASGADLATTASIMASTLNSFKLKASESAKVADILATAANDSAADVKYMGDALKYAGTPANALGVSLEDTSAAIEIMSNSGLEGSQAGTALRASFIRLAKPSEKASKQMEKMGIHLENSKGKFVGMPALIGQFKDELSGMSKAEKLASVAAIVGTEAASGFLALIEAGPKKLEKYSTSLKNSGGASKTAADKMKDNLKGSLEQLGGAFESLAIIIGNAFGPALRKLADAVTFVVDKISKLPKSVIVIGTILTGLAATIPPLLILFGFMATSIVNIASVIGPLLIGVSKAGGLMAFLSSKLATATRMFPLLGSAITFAGGPLLWIVGGLTALGIGFTIAYKKSETFRNIVNNAINGVKQTFINVGNIIKGFFQLFKGNGQDGVITLSKILPPNVVVGLTNFATKVKTIFFQVVNAVKSFGMEIGKQISTFWKQNGAEITQAVKNVGNVISTVFKFIWSYVIKPIMTLIWNIMKLLWPAIKALIVSVWNNIKGVIKGALDIILGTVKIFSALFTGNWKGVWQGVKQVALGALRLLWNLVQLWFVGKILKVVKLFGGFLKTTMSGIWSAIKGIFSKSLGAIWNITKKIFGKVFNSTKGIFTNTKNFLLKIWTSIKNFIVKTATSIWTNVRNKFTGLYKSVKSIFTSVKNFTQKLWTSLKNNVVKLAKSLWSNVKNIFTKLYNTVKDLFNRTFNFAKNLWTKLRNTIKNLATSAWSNVKNIFTKLWNSVKSIFTKTFNFTKNLWTRIKNTITTLVTGAKNGVIKGFKAMYDKGKSWINKLKGFLSDSVSGFKNIASKVGKGIANGAISGLNKMIDGVNWLSKKIMDKKLIGSKVPKLSTGTGSNGDVKANSKGQLQENTLAMVNDKGPGNGKGRNGHQELIRDKDGTMFAPQGRNVIVPLSKGMEVINGKQTQSMMSSGMIPRFSAGSGTKNQTNSMTDSFKQGWDIVGAVSKATTKATVKSVSKKGGELAGKATSKALEVWDYIENPGKLVQIALDKFGVDFSKIKGVYGSFMKHGFAGLKKGLVKKVMSWFDEAGGFGDVDGSSILKHGISYGYSPNKPLAGYPLSINGGRHYGIDTPHQYEKIQAPTGGIVRKQYDPGGGTVAQILNGKLAQYYLHLTDVLKTGRIKKGQTFAKTGNSGANTTGPHLHTQIEEPAANALTNRNTKDPVKFLKSKGGKSGGSWLGTVRTALKIAKLPVTQKYINAWMKQIETESSGNPRAMGGNDGLSDGNAMGLVQVKPGTFKANQGKGMGNIWNPLHNLVAGMNYAKGRYRNSMLGVIGKGHGYATGGLINTPGWYNIAEQGHGEWIIPRDPSRRNDAMKLLALAANDIKSNNNKRPNQLPSPKNSNNGNPDTSLLMKMIEKQDETINALKASVELLTQIAAKNYEPVIDKYEHEKQIFKGIEKYERTKQRTGKYRPAY